MTVIKGPRSLKAFSKAWIELTPEPVTGGKGRGRAVKLDPNVTCDLYIISNHFSNQWEHSTNIHCARGSHEARRLTSILQASASPSGSPIGSPLKTARAGLTAPNNGGLNMTNVSTWLCSHFSKSSRPDMEASTYCRNARKTIPPKLCVITTAGRPSLLTVLSIFFRSLRGVSSRRRYLRSKLQGYGPSSGGIK